MRLCAVIPDEGWGDSAGVRIRYGRIGKALRDLGHELEIRPIDSFSSKENHRADVYVISKCHDRRAPLLAALMRGRGARVGVDVFDDYYSDRADARFVHLRNWFRSIVPEIDFLLCATEPMAERLARLAPDLPCHMMNDPGTPIDPDALAAGLTRRIAEAKLGGHVSVAWFGIGDNPHFPVGLEDLAAFAWVLDRLRSGGWTVSLDVLTNRRALTCERLQMLARLPLPARLEQWSEEREAALLGRAQVAFLPVNGQDFSVAKSLNRAVTALSHGAQVLSAGYPLYRRLDALVYRDAGELFADLAEGRPRLRPETVPDLQRALARLGDPAAEARGLLDFLRGLEAGRPGTQCRAVLHGPHSTAALHKSVQRLGGLSVSGPGTRLRVHFDVEPVPAPGGGVQVHLSPRAVALLRAELRDAAQVRTLPDGRTVSVLELPEKAWPESGTGAPLVRAIELGRHGPGFDAMQALMAEMFGPTRLYLSEPRLPMPEPEAAGV